MSDFVLDKNNYHSVDARKRYVDCSIYKEAIGTVGRKGCECRAVAISQGKWETPKTEALMVGSYVDAYFDNSLDQFKEENPQIFTKAGTLKAEFKQADIMIERAKRDELWMKYMQGDTQVIETAEIAGVPVRVKLDSFDGKRITDLKTCASISETYYAKDLGERLDFATYFGYVEQAFFYTEVMYKVTGRHYPFYLCCVTKEKESNVPHPRLAVIQIPDKIIEERREQIEWNIPKVWSLIQGKIDPIPCGTCSWCADNLPLEEVISLDELLLEV